MKKNNILFIMTDQMRWDALGITGGWVNTPHLDKIASKGMLFNHCITNAPVCIPARVSLATGLYPHNTGIWRNCPYDLPVSSRTWMQCIRNAGYRTALIGKTHLHRHTGDLRDREDLLHAYGFDDINEIGGPRASMRVGSYMTDEWEKKGLWEPYIQDYKSRFDNKPYIAKPSPLPLDLYPDVYVGRQAKQYIQKYDSDQPWFLMVSFGGPHEPWDAPEPYEKMYQPEEMPKAIRRPDLYKDQVKGLLHQWMYNDQKHSPDISDREVQQMRANYAGNVTLIDDQIGEILSTLESKEELDHTIIVFTSDHGEMNGDYGLIYKETMLNSAVKVPLIVSVPGQEENHHYSDQMVEMFDIGPTLVELAGGDLEYTQFAKSLVPVLENPNSPHRDVAISESRGEIMIQNQTWKLVFNQQGMTYLLFHIMTDPDEQHNLVSYEKYQRVINDLSTILLKHILSTIHVDRQNQI